MRPIVCRANHSIAHCCGDRWSLAFLLRRDGEDDVACPACLDSRSSCWLLDSSIEDVMMIEPASFLMMNVVCVVQVSVCDVCLCVIAIVIVIVTVWHVSFLMLVHVWMMIESDWYDHPFYWMMYVCLSFDHYVCDLMVKVVMMMMMMRMIVSLPFLSHL